MLVDALTLVFIGAVVAWGVSVEIRLRKKPEKPELLRVSVPDYSYQKIADSQLLWTNPDEPQLRPVAERMRLRSYNPIKAAMDREDAEIKAIVKARQDAEKG